MATRMAQLTTAETVKLNVMTMDLASVAGAHKRQKKVGHITDMRGNEVEGPSSDNPVFFLI